MNTPPISDDRMLEALAQQLAEHALRLDSVAIPGFGKFQGIKNDETIVTDHATGKRLLLPPEIIISFTSSGSLRNRLAK